MFKSVTIILLTLLLSSCKEDTTYQMQLVIENISENKISIELFPKNEYLHNNLYSFCDFGGGYRETTFELDANNEIEIYISSELNIKPYAKATEIFDSIHISDFEGESYKIRFSPEKVIGYDENLFREESFWEMKSQKYDLPTSFQKNQVESSDYIFGISNEKITPHNKPL